MKFTCNARELNTACNNVMRAVSTKMTVPTIEGILMECGSDTLSLTGYDFEFGINTTLQASVTEPGAIVINAKVLCNIIKELTAETVTFDISGTLFLLFAALPNMPLPVLTQTIIRNCPASAAAILCS